MENIQLFYMDGYHGGIRGHMPLGCWRDILRMLKEYPQWKLSLDVEPVSWDYIKSRDPAIYEEFQNMLRDQSETSRLEIVAGSYGQPYCWTTDGESNIRHLELGIKTLKKHFPWLKVKTYAVQEPCWTSAFPQILRSFAIEQAVLKNPSTAWGGYSEGFDAETFFWEGPDGSVIPAVPRYECEELLNAWETESVNGTKDFALKCIHHGISHPTGMYYQDLGWPSQPGMKGRSGGEDAYSTEHIVYATWKEYFKKIALQPKKVLKVSQEIFHVALPWGERLLVRMARQIRRGEITLLTSERLQALSRMLCSKQGSYAIMKGAWEHLLLSQHHDGWICASAGKEEENWAWKTSAQIYAAKSLTEPMDRQALYDLGKYACPVVKQSNQETICVVNPLARREQRVVEVAMTSDPGVKSFCVYDNDEELRSQYIANRSFPDGSKNAGTLLFEAKLPAFGVKTFRIQPDRKEDCCKSPMAAIDKELAWLETDRYRISFDLRHGGIISSLFDKLRGKEITNHDGERKFNEYRGYFINEGRFVSSTEQRAQAKIVFSGPVRAAVMIQGKLGEATFTQTVSLTQGDAKIIVDVTFNFPEKTYIGESHEIAPKEKATDRHRSYHDGTFKLNAYFPTTFQQKKVCKDAAYDVCESSLKDTKFKRWDEIKHNILVGWVDVSDSEQGLTIMSDHTTSYIHAKDIPLGLTMAWGGEAGYWWGKRQLKGNHSLSYAIVAHAKDWQQADIWHEYQKMLHLPMAQRIAGQAVFPNHYELIAVDGAIEMSAAYLDEQNRMLVRLFNPGPPVCARVEIPVERAALVELVELDESVSDGLEILYRSSKAVVSLYMPEFKICTLRITPYDIR